MLLEYTTLDVVLYQVLQVSETTVDISPNLRTFQSQLH